MASDDPPKPGKPRIVSEEESEQILRPSAPRGEDDAADAEPQAAIPTEVGVLPVRNLVVFPGMVIPLGIGREKSRRLINATLPHGKIIVSIAQKQFEVEEPSPDDLYSVGTAVMIYAGLKLQLTLGVGDVLALVVLPPSAALVYMGVFLAITSVSFWHEDRMGLAPPVYNIIRFSRYPITIFSLPVRIFLTFVLPFAWVAFYPAAWFVGGEQFSRIGLFTPLVGAVVFGGAIVIWGRGIRNYTSTGS